MAEALLFLQSLQHRAVFALRNRRITEVLVRDLDVLSAGAIFHVDMREVARIVSDKVLPVSTCQRLD